MIYVLETDNSCANIEMAYPNPRTFDVLKNLQPHTSASYNSYHGKAQLTEHNVLSTASFASSFLHVTVPSLPDLETRNCIVPIHIAKPSPNPAHQ